MARPTDLTPELTLRIRQLVLEGLMYKDIQERLGILAGTWDKWNYEDYKDFRKNLISWKQERLLKKSEKLSDDILDLPHTDEKGKPDTNILRVKQKEAEFVRSTLGKNDGYSTKTESEIRVTELPTPILNHVFSDDSTQKNSEVKEEN
jgi:hypothetical protein